MEVCVVCGTVPSECVIGREYCACGRLEHHDGSWWTLWLLPWRLRGPTGPCSAVTGTFGSPGRAWEMSEGGEHGGELPAGELDATVERLRTMAGVAEVMLS